MSVARDPRTRRASLPRRAVRRARRGAAAPVRPLLDRVLARLAGVVLLGFFRSVEVDGLLRVPEGRRPVLVVANHFNGLVDAVALVAVLGRMPRFLAKATLWRVLPARPFLALAGLIPVHRRVDAADTSRNASTFAAAHAVLGARRMVAMFPEGISHDDARLAEVRTGAARIALGAQVAGVRGLVVLPVGLSYESKVAVRSRLLVRVGEPIDVDATTGVGAGGAAPGEGARDAVATLTARIERRLRSVTPDYASPFERSALGMAADVAVRRVGRPEVEVPLAARERLAQRLANRPADVRARVRALLADYHLDLAAVEVDDAEVAAGYSARRVLLHLVITLALVAALSPVAVAGAAVNLLPASLVVAAGRRVVRPVTKGTVRVLTAVLVFPPAWFGVATALVDGWWRVTLLGIALAAAGLLAVRLAEALLRALSDYRSWRCVQDRAGVLPDVRARREHLVAAIHDAAK